MTTSGFEFKGIGNWIVEELIVLGYDTVYQRQSNFNESSLRLRIGKQAPHLDLSPELVALAELVAAKTKADRAT